MIRLSNGFSTGTALQLWLFFLISFYFLGYSVPLSILLGLAGGLGGGLVIGWWKTKDNPNDLQPVEPDVEEEEGPAKVSGLRLAKQRRDEAKGRRRSQRSLTSSFTSFLKK
ncbi:MAG TPA: hypothetical protein V6D14_28430 [Coleofasciculaceae cyanobacterium]|jgi:hypothetical protein